MPSDKSTDKWSFQKCQVTCSIPCSLLFCFLSRAGIFSQQFEYYIESFT